MPEIADPPPLKEIIESDDWKTLAPEDRAKVVDGWKSDVIAKAKTFPDWTPDHEIAIHNAGADALQGKPIGSFQSESSAPLADAMGGNTMRTPEDTSLGARQVLGEIAAVPPVDYNESTLHILEGALNQPLGGTIPTPGVFKGSEPGADLLINTAAKVGVDLANFIRSPLGIATAGMGTLPKIVRSAVAAAFTVHGAMNAQDAVTALANAKTDEEKRNALAGILETGGEMAGGLSHLAGREGIGTPERPEPTPVQQPVEQPTQGEPNAVNEISQPESIQPEQQPAASADNETPSETTASVGDAPTIPETPEITQPVTETAQEPAVVQPGSEATSQVKQPSRFSPLPWQDNEALSHFKENITGLHPEELLDEMVKVSESVPEPNQFRGDETKDWAKNSFDAQKLKLLQEEWLKQGADVSGAMGKYEDITKALSGSSDYSESLKGKFEKLKVAAKAISTPVEETAAPQIAAAEGQPGPTAEPPPVGTPTAASGNKPPAPVAPNASPMQKLLAAEQDLKSRLKLSKKAKEGGFIDPSILNDIVEHGKRFYEKAVTFAQWSKTMIERLGEHVGAYLKDAWKRMQSENGSLFGGGGLKIPVGEKLEQTQLGDLAEAASPRDEKNPHGIGAFLDTISGDSAPRTTRANRETGEALVRWASSRNAAIPAGKLHGDLIVEAGGVDPVEFGKNVTADQLFSIRDNFREQAAEAADKGDLEKAKTLSEQADATDANITKHGFNEGEVKSYFEKPDVQESVTMGKELHDSLVDPMYRKAAGIDPEEALPSRGKYSDLRINLFAKTAENIENPAAQPAVKGGSILDTLRRKTPFARKAAGTGDYNYDIRDIMANTYARQLEIANRRAAEDALISSGNAYLDKPGASRDIKGEPAIAFPSDRKTLITTKSGETITIPKSQNLYVRKSLATEYINIRDGKPARAAAAISKFAMPFTKLSMSGLTEGVAHLGNQMTSLFTLPAGSGGLLTDTMLKAMGGSNAIVNVVKSVTKAAQDNRAQWVKLLEIGAGRGEHESTGALKVSGWMGRGLQRSDKIVRLMADDAFSSMAKDGIVPDTETARREFINSHIGQYNKLLQGSVIRFLRESQVAPFATAGRTFAARGVKMAGLSPGTPATSAATALLLRANMLAGWVGAAALLGTINYMLTKDKGGGALGRPGTKLGDIDTGLTTDAGKQVSIPLGTIMGYTRGLRVSGIRGFVDAKRIGLPTTLAAEAGVRDIANSGLSIGAGPAVKFATEALGYEPAVGIPSGAPAALPGESQFVQNLKYAAMNTSPISSTFQESQKPESTLATILQKQLGRFAPTEGMKTEIVDKFPKIVHSAQLYKFADWTTHTARRLPEDKKNQFIQEQLGRLPDDEDRKKLLNYMKMRGVKIQ